MNDSFEIRNFVLEGKFDIFNLVLLFYSLSVVESMTLADFLYQRLRQFVNIFIICKNFNQSIDFF